MLWVSVAKEKGNEHSFQIKLGEHVLFLFIHRCSDTFSDFLLELAQHLSSRRLFCFLIEAVPYPWMRFLAAITYVDTLSATTASPLFALSQSFSSHSLFATRILRIFESAWAFG